LYANTLIVPSGTTLNLNGLHVYARASSLLGTVTGGLVTTLPSGGPFTLGTTTPGALNAPGATHEWTLYAFAGRAISVVVNTGTAGSATPPLAPYLNDAQVTLLDPSGSVLASGSTTTSGADVILAGISLSAEGTYGVRVQASPSHPNSVG